MTAMVERRRELRTQADLAVRISGRDASGKLFAQSAVASSISGGGALLSGMAREVRSGDLIWIEYQDRKARFRIVWVRDSESEQKTQAAVHKLEKEECPWKSLVAALEATYEAQGIAEDGKFDAEALKPGQS
jgi:hypothetical protein